MRTVLFSDGVVREFPPVAHKIPELADVSRRDKTAGNQPVLKDICNPLGILLIGLLTSDSFHIFGMSKNNLTS